VEVTVGRGRDETRRVRRAGKLLNCIPSTGVGKGKGEGEGGGKQPKDKCRLM